MEDHGEQVSVLADVQRLGNIEVTISVAAGKDNSAKY